MLGLVYHTFGFTFSDYPWEHHLRQKQSDVPVEECYRESWKYFIALMLCTLILKNRTAIELYFGFARGFIRYRKICA